MGDHKKEVPLGHLLKLDSSKKHLKRYNLVLVLLSQRWFTSIKIEESRPQAYITRPACVKYSLKSVYVNNRVRWKKNSLTRFSKSSSILLVPFRIVPRSLASLKRSRKNSLWLQLSLSSLPFIFKKKNAPNRVNAPIEQVKKDFSPFDIQLRSKAYNEFVRTGLGDFSISTPFCTTLANTAVRCRSSPLSISPFIAYLRRTARFMPAARFIFIKKELRSLKRKYFGKKEDESHCGRDSKATQGERSCVNDIWSHITFTIFKKNYFKIKRQIQTSKREVRQARQAIQLLPSFVYGNCSSTKRRTKME